MILLLFYFVSCNQSNQIQQYLISGNTMGTTYHIKVISKPLNDKFISNIKSALDSSLVRVNQQMSTYIPDSEISRFNQHNSTEGFKVSDEFAKVLDEALEVHKLSSGAFDITVNPLVNLWGFGSQSKKKILPSESDIKNTLRRIGSQHIIFKNKNTIAKNIPDLEIDLSAIAKGYGVDVTTQVLDGFNLDRYMVEIGGEVFVKGKNYYDENWRIGIDKPKYLAFPGNELQDTLSITNVAVATSGDYRNYFEYQDKIYSHTINPKTGRPVTHNLASVTVIAPNCMKADAIATAVLVLGVEQGLKLLESIDNVEGYLIARKGGNQFEVYGTSDFQKYLSKIKN